jgi:hypothetical protein
MVPATQQAGAAPKRKHSLRPACMGEQYRLPFSCEPEDDGLIRAMGYVFQTCPRDIGSPVCARRRGSLSIPPSPRD